MTSISAGGRSERNKDFQGEKNKKAAIKPGRQSKEGKISHARQVIKKKKKARLKLETQTGD